MEDAGGGGLGRDRERGHHDLRHVRLRPGNGRQDRHSTCREANPIPEQRAGGVEEDQSAMFKQNFWFIGDYDFLRKQIVDDGIFGDLSTRFTRFKITSGIASRC